MLESKKLKTQKYTYKSNKSQANVSENELKAAIHSVNIDTDQLRAITDVCVVLEGVDGSN